MMTSFRRLTKSSTSLAWLAAAGAALSLHAPSAADAQRSLRGVYDPATVLSAVSHWPQAMSPLRGQLDPNKNYITWIIKAPGAPMDLRSAEDFRRYVISAGSLDELGISHMMVGWQCNGRVGLTGFTGESQKQSSKMIDLGWGQSTFLAIFTDGELNMPHVINWAIDSAAKRSIPIGHLTFEVTAQQCGNMLAFLSSFVSHPNRPSSNFGMNLDPLKYEGGGCGSFASAMLTKAGVMRSVQPNMWRTLKGTRRLMGRNLELPPHTFLSPAINQAGTGGFVWKGTLQTEEWSYGDGPALRVLDPELGLYAFHVIGQEYLRSARLDASALSGTAFAPRTIQQASWQHRGGSAIRTWHEAEIAINGDYDRYHSGQAGIVGRAAMTELRKSYKKIKPVYIGSHLGLLISK